MPSNIHSREQYLALEAARDQRTHNERFSDVSSWALVIVIALFLIYKAIQENLDMRRERKQRRK